MPEHGTLTLQKLFDKFDAASVTQGTTRQKCRSAWGVLTHLLGSTTRADSVTDEDVLRYQRHLRDEALSRHGKSYSEHSVFSYVAAVSQVFRWAEDRRLLAENPVRRAEKMRPTKKQVHIYSRDEISDMLATVRGDPDHDIASLKWPDAAGELRWTAFFLMALTGPRVGEVWNLRWDDIDLETGTVHIQSRTDRLGEYWRWTAKGKAERDVPMSDDLWATMMRLREVAPWRYPFLKERTCRDKQARAGSLSEFARKYPYNNFHRELRLVLDRTNARRRKAGREPLSDGRFHTLRKNTATRMAEEGVPSHFTQEILGHATDRLTKEVYTYVDRRKCLEASRRAFNSVSY